MASVLLPFAFQVTGSDSDLVCRGDAGARTGIDMKGGTILIGGSAGLEVGMRMKRGIIAVGGPVRDFAGLQMKGGTIVLRSGAEIRTGAWMFRGTIVSLSGDLRQMFLEATQGLFQAFAGAKNDPRQVMIAHLWTLYARK